MTQPDDPYAAALAALADPPGETVAERDVARFEARLALRAIRRELAAAAPGIAVVLVLAALGWALAPLVVP